MLSAWHPITTANDKDNLASISLKGIRTEHVVNKLSNPVRKELTENLGHGDNSWLATFQLFRPHFEYNINAKLLQLLKTE